MAGGMYLVRYQQGVPAPHRSLSDAVEHILVLQIASGIVRNGRQRSVDAVYM